MSAANELTQWSRLLFSSLADAGVRDVVVSPGSRSTPFVVAAAAEPRIRCHSAIDERAGGFFALGQARATGRPSAVLSTSGTAAAHYLPAVIEASLAFVPLVVVTSDRPLELQDSSAPQTIDQIKLFGDYVRRFYELGAPDPDPAALLGLRRLALQAVHFAKFPVPGPVHLNARARKPLEPRAAATEEERELERTVNRLLARSPAAARPPTLLPDDEAADEIAERLRGTRNGLVVAGPAPPATKQGRRAVFDLCRALGYPLLAESTSQLRFGDVPADVSVCDAFDLVLRVREFADVHAPDVIVQLGSTPTSSAWEQFETRHRDAYKVVIAAHGWPDPSSTLSILLPADPQRACGALVERIGHRRGAPSAWARDFVAAGEHAWKLVDELLDAEEGRLRDGHVVAEVLENLPAASTFVVANSLPVREVDLYGRTGSADVDVICQRGANGIDGLVAGSAGVASVTDRPVTLLIGDVALLHDLNALLLAARSPVPLVVVVLQNNGGRIFEQLPLAKADGVPDGVMDLITTPHEHSFADAARFFGIGYNSATTTGELRAALGDAYNRAGCHLVEAVVPPNGAAEDLTRLVSALRALIA